MMPLSEKDLVSRSIIYSKAFLNSIHVDEHLFIFGATKEDGASHESAIARRLAQQDAEAHRVGCKIASLQNGRTAETSGGTVSVHKRRYYCGFRAGVVGDMTLAGEKYRIELTIDGVTEEPSHVDVALFVDSDDRNERNTIKTEAGLALAEAFGPAVESICSEDETDENHPLKRNPNCLREGLPRYIGI